MQQYNSIAASSTQVLAAWAEHHTVLQVLPNLHIFSDELLTDAKRRHVLTQSRDPQLYKSMGCRNTSRGSDMSTGRTRVRSPTNSSGEPLPEHVQGLQDTQVSQASGEMDVNPVNLVRG
jgi:hypothetical protein